jgi:hypothetical protein
VKKDLTMKCLFSPFKKVLKQFFKSSGSNTFSTNEISFSYDTTISPTISSLATSSGSNTELTITGSGFGSNSSIYKHLISIKIIKTISRFHQIIFKFSLKAAASVLIGGNKSMCAITSISDTQIVCSLDGRSAGSYSVVVRLDNQGNSNKDKNITFNLIINSLSTNIGKFSFRTKDFYYSNQIFSL